MIFRKSKDKDVTSIMEIISHAQEYFKEKEIDQWQNNYPNEDTIKNDIKKDASYVLESDGIILATTALFYEKEEPYTKIDGKWLSEKDYCTIHRLAVKPEEKGKNLASDILMFIEYICIEIGIKSIKVDTHTQNYSMRRFLEKNDFIYCGIIYLEDGSPRVAYEKEIKYVNITTKK